MKKRMLSMVLTVMLLCMAASFPAMAEDVMTVAAEPKSIAIGTSMDLDGTKPSPAETYEIVMKADKDGNPLPEGAEGQYTLTITGEGRKNFPEMVYTKPGVYEYTIYQIPGDNKDCDYDDTVYHLTVTITNNGEGGFNAMAVLSVEGSEHKPDEAGFKNKYPVKEGDDTPTGVEDNWMLYLGCSVILLAVGIFLFIRIRRKNEEDDDEFDLGEE